MMGERGRALGLPDALVALLDELPFEVSVRDPGGVCVYANPVALRRWPAMVGERPDATPVAVRVRDIWTSGLRAALEGRVVAREVVYPHGTSLHLVAPVRREGEIVAVLAVDLDVTELAESRTGLAVRDRLVSMVSDQLPVLIGVRRLVQGRTEDGETVPDLLHVFDNALTARLLGESPAELEGKTDRQLRAPEAVLERAIHRFETARERGAPVPFQMLYPRGEGHGVIEGEAAHLGAESGDDDLFAFVGRDVTAERALQSELIRADRMSGLATSVAVAGHEIANPLTYGIMSASAAREALDDTSRPAEARIREALGRVEETESALARAAALLDDLRNLAGEERPPEPADVGEVVQSVLGLTRTGLERIARIDVRLEESPPVYISPLRLGQAVLNLLKNASEAFENDDPSRNRIAVEVAARGRGVSLEIRDNGPGFPLDRVDELLAPFARGDGSPGTGLGLYVVKRVIEGGGGRMAVRRPPDGGTAFDLWLPSMAHSPLRA